MGRSRLLLKARMRSVAQSLLLAVLSLPALAACATTSGESTAARTLDAATVRSATAAWAEVQGTKGRLRDVERVLLTACMRRQGFAVFPPAPIAIPDPPNVAVSPTPEEARSRGYGLVPIRDAPTQGGASAWDGAPDEYKARYAMAYNGSDAERVTYEFPGGGYQISAGGCYGDVRRLLFGDLRIYIKLDWLSSNQIYQETQSLISADQALRAAEVTWAECMKAAGYSLSIHSDAVHLAQGKRSTGQSADVEFAIAVADAQCASDSGYRREQLRATSAAESTVLGEHAPDIIAWRQLVSEAISKGTAAIKAAS